MLPFISVIIPIYNEEKFIRRNMESLIDQDYPADRYEIIAVDGGSTDGSMEIVRELAGSGRVMIFDNPGRIAASAINIGTKNAKGDIITRVDAHSYVDRDYLSSIAKVFEETGEKVVGGPVRMVIDTSFRKAASYVLNSKLGVGSVPYRTLRKRAYVDSIQTGSFKREVLEKVGYFDETLPPGEDFELNTRIRKAGYRIILDPEIKFYYFPRNSFGSLSRQYFHYGRVKPIVLSKHTEAVKVKYFVPALFTVSFLLSVLLLIEKIWSGYSPGWLFFNLWLLNALYLLMIVVFTLSSIPLLGLRPAAIVFLITPLIHLSYGMGFIYGSFQAIRRLLIRIK
ncbi:MAG: glycosyltransferase family 2 protein [Acidobacteriota bacterium]